MNNNIPLRFFRPDFGLPSTRPKLIQEFPKDELSRMVVKVNVLSALFWDYTDSVICCGKILHCDQTKRLARVLRKFKADYDRTRSRSLDDEWIRLEQELALTLEEVCYPHISQMRQEVRKEVCDRFPDVNNEWLTLIVAVHEAMTLADVIRQFAKACDQRIYDFGARVKHSIVTTEVQRTIPLIAEFAGDMYFLPQSRKQAAEKILAEVVNIDIYDEHGKV